MKPEILLFLSKWICRHSFLFNWFINRFGNAVGQKYKKNILITKFVLYFDDLHNIVVDY